MSDSPLPPITAPVTIADIGARLPEAILAGDTSLQVERMVHPLDWRGPADLPLILGAPALQVIDAGARCAVVAKEVADAAPEKIEQLGAAVIVERARHALAFLTPMFPRTPDATPAEGIHPTAVIEEGAEIGENCRIGALVYVGSQAKIGAGCILHPNSTVAAGAVLGDSCILKPGSRISDSVTLGDRVIVNENAVIGSDGFAFVTPEKGAEEAVKGGQRQGLDHKSGEILRIDSLGSVQIGNDVEIGAGTTVDRATLGSTSIKSGTKVDNLVQLAHNVELGENCFICAHVGIAGSSKVGSRTILAGQVGVADHMSIGDDCVVMGGSAVTKKLDSGGVYFGFPAQPAQKELRARALTNRLEQMVSDLKKLKRQIKELEADK